MNSEAFEPCGSLGKAGTGQHPWVRDRGALQAASRVRGRKGLVFRVQGLGFKVQGLGFRVQGLGFRFRVRFFFSGLGLGFRVYDVRVHGSGFGLKGACCEGNIPEQHCFCVLCMLSLRRALRVYLSRNPPSGPIVLPSALKGDCKAHPTRECCPLLFRGPKLIFAAAVRFGVCKVEPGNFFGFT